MPDGPLEQSPNEPGLAELNQVIMRQHRVIEKLKEQIGNIVLANTEASARMDEYREENGDLRAQLSMQDELINQHA